jgi:hypothetical protein
MAAGITLTGALMIYFLGRRQDNKQRFVADRRTAYADLVSSFVDIRMLITHDEPRDGEALLQGMKTFENADFNPAMLRMLFDEHKANVARTHSRADRIRDRLQGAAAVVYLLAPESVRNKVADVMDLSADATEFCGKPGEIAIQRLIAVMRTDLGIETEASPAIPTAAGAMTWTADSMRVGPRQ